jgi:hypothetical protein
MLGAGLAPTPARRFNRMVNTGTPGSAPPTNAIQNSVLSVCLNSL